MAYWVVSVNRETGSATTVFIADKDTAWQLAVDMGDPNTYTTVATATTTEGAQQRD